MSSPRRFMQIFDAHSGWDRRHERGQWVVRPTFSLPAWRATVRFAQEFCPTILTWGGDQLNFGPISHWHQGKPIIDEGFRLKREMDNFAEHLLIPMEEVIGRDGLRQWHYGNHEKWILDHVEKHPGLEGMVEPENYLGLWDRNYEVYSPGEISNIGKLFTVHGDKVFKRGTGQCPAKTLVNRYRRNIRCGHIHTFSVAMLHTAVDSKDYHSGVTVPGLCTRSFAYDPDLPNNHVMGFNAGYLYSDGSFQDWVVMIHNGKVIYNGKIIDGNKK